MASLNKVLLMGNLGRDPEVKYTSSGQAVATFTMATNRRWKDKEGNSQEDTQWHNIKMWGRSAELAQQYLKKGRTIFVEGRIETRTYDDKDGNRKWFTEIVCERFQFVGSRGDDAGGGGGNSGGNYSGGSNQPQPQPSTSMNDEDDLPF